MWKRAKRERQGGAQRWLSVLRTMALTRIKRSLVRFTLVTNCVETNELSLLRCELPWKTFSARTHRSIVVIKICRTIRDTKGVRGKRKVEEGRERVRRETREGERVLSIPTTPRRTANECVGQRYRVRFNYRNHYDDCSRTCNSFANDSPESRVPEIISFRYQRWVNIAGSRGLSVEVGGGNSVGR